MTRVERGNGMTHEAYERGEYLTIHNANKTQLKCMIEDRDIRIKNLYDEIEEYKRTIDGLCTMIARLTEKPA